MPLDVRRTMVLVDAGGLNALAVVGTRKTSERVTRISHRYQNL
jgi:hypothetical protein